MSGTPNPEVDMTAALSKVAREIRFEALPSDVVFLAKQCLLDWFGVALAGAREPLTELLRSEVLEQGGHPQATLVGSGERVSVQQAALVNGAASHALDYDDVQITMSGHPTVPVAPALLALAEARQSSGRDVLAALVAGIEMECRVGALVMPGHYRTGWHATGTLGTFGAAAACCHLLGLGQDQWQTAMGIAGTQAAGLKAMFGTMCKPLHAGKAAANGLLAATLAQRGFTSNPGVLDVPQGFTATQTSTPHPERALEGLGESYAIRSVLFKYHAACYGTHETIEGVLRLKERHSLRPDDVREIRLTVPEGNLSMCNIQSPATALEGKFSLRFTAALALARDDTSDHAFTGEAVSNPALTQLRNRVSVTGRPSSGMGTDVSMVLADGREVREFVNLETPAGDLDRQWQRLAAKYVSLASDVVGETQARQLLETVEHTEELSSLSELFRLAVPARRTEVVR